MQIEEEEGLFGLLFLLSAASINPGGWMANNGSLMWKISHKWALEQVSSLCNCKSSAIQVIACRNPSITVESHQGLNKKKLYIYIQS